MSMSEVSTENIKQTLMISFPFMIHVPHKSLLCARHGEDALHTALGIMSSEPPANTGSVC